MARLFDDAIPNYLEAASAVLTGVPISMAGWFNSDDLTIDQTIVGIGRSDTTVNYFVLVAAGLAAGDPVRVILQDAGDFSLVGTTTSYSADTWHHAAGVFTAIDDISVFLDGGGKASETVTSVTPVGVNRTSMGALVRSDVVSAMSGRIAEVGIWNIALTDAEVAILAQGYSPLLMRPQNLVFYVPLVREIQDVVGGVVLTDNS